MYRNLLHSRTPWFHLLLSPCSEWLCLELPNVLTNVPGQILKVQKSYQGKNATIFNVPGTFLSEVIPGKFKNLKFAWKKKFEDSLQAKFNKLKILPKIQVFQVYLGIILRWVAQGCSNWARHNCTNSKSKQRTIQQFQMCLADSCMPATTGCMVVSIVDRAHTPPKLLESVTWDFQKTSEGGAKLAMIPYWLHCPLF